LARSRLRNVDSVNFPGSFVQFTLADNPGAFLSLGSTLSRPARVALSIGSGLVLAGLLAYLVRTRELRPAPFLGLALVCAGGASNLIDRFARHGLVTDFVIVRAGPLHTGVFNLADSAIILGILLLAAGTFRARSDLNLPN